VLEPGCNERSMDSGRDYSRFAHGFIDGTVVNVALPALQSALRATLADVQWVVKSYALSLAMLVLVGGSLGDTYRRRKKTSDQGYPVLEHVKRLVDDKIVWAPAIDGAFVLPMRGVDFEKATRAGEKLSRMHSSWATALGCG
jgi:hypothetical protein